MTSIEKWEFFLHLSENFCAEKKLSVSDLWGYLEGGGPEFSNSFFKNTILTYTTILTLLVRLA